MLHGEALVLRLLPLSPVLGFIASFKFMYMILLGFIIFNDPHGHPPRAWV